MAEIATGTPSPTDELATAAEIVATVDSGSAANPETPADDDNFGAAEKEAIIKKLAQKKEKKVEDFLARQEQTAQEPAYAYSAQTKAAETAQLLWAEKKGLVAAGFSYLQRSRAQRQLRAALATTLGTEAAKEEAQNILTHLEQTGSTALYRSRINQETRKNETSLSYDGLVNGKLAETFRLITNPLASIKNAEQLCGNQWEFILLYPRSPEYTQLINELNILGTIPSEVISTVATQLRNLQIISPNLLVPDQDLTLITEICVAGGFSPEQLHQLDTIKRIHQLAGIYNDLSLKAAFGEYHKAKDMLTVAENIIQSYDQELVEEITTYRFHNEEKIFTLEKDVLSKLVEIIIARENGITPEFITKCIQSGVEIATYDWEELRRLISEPSFASLRSFRDQEREQRQERFATVERSISSKRLEYARALAQSDGKNLNTVNTGHFLYLDQIIVDAREKITELNAEERLRFYQRLLSSKGSSDFWESVSGELTSKYLSDDETDELRRVLLHHLVLEIFSPEGTVDSNLVAEAYNGDICNDDSLLAYLPDNERPFFTYVMSLPEDLRLTLKRHKSEFSELVQNGQETPKLMALFLRRLGVRGFLPYLTKSRFAFLVGDAQSEAFLSVLPKETDERRNAFTHNQYDRTSDLIKFLINNYNVEFDITTDLPILTDFVKEFGLSRSAEIYNLFRLVWLFEKGQLAEKPAELIEYGIDSLEQLLKEVKELKQALMSETPLRGVDLEKFNGFKIQLMKVITGKSTHRFDSGRPDFQKIINDFITADKNGEISPVPEGYKSSQIEVRNVTIDFDPHPIEANFAIIKNEILDSILHRQEVGDLVKEILRHITQNITETKQSLETIDPNKRQFIEKKIRDLELSLDILTKMTTSDQLLVFLLKLDLGKAGLVVINSLKRKVILRKVFEHHFSQAFIQDVQMRLEAEISPAGVLTVLNIVDELVKQHAINLQANAEGVQAYWSPETVEALKTLKSGKKISEIFSGIRDELKTAVDNFVVNEQDSKRIISVVPERDFVAEVAGYLADVCYTKEYPLLKDRPVVPYKFVVGSENLDLAELGGSVLIFEVTNANGEECLLVRGFDYRDEEKTRV